MSALILSAEPCTQITRWWELDTTHTVFYTSAASLATNRLAAGITFLSWHSPDYDFTICLFVRPSHVSFVSQEAQLSQTDRAILGLVSLNIWPSHSRSFEMVQLESFGTVSYSHFIATMAVSLAVCEIFSAKERRVLEMWVSGRSMA